MGTTSSTPLRLAADKELLEIPQLACVRWKNELATSAVRHSVRYAIVIERAIPANAEIGLEAAFRVATPRVDDLAITEMEV
jgi:hypothetical protein